MPAMPWMEAARTTRFCLGVGGLVWVRARVWGWEEQAPSHGSKQHLHVLLPKIGTVRVWFGQGLDGLGL